MRPIPRDASLDNALALKRDPYGFIAERCRRFGTDLFRTRIMLRDTICMTGAEAAEVFYDASRFVRHGAAPERIQTTLFGKGGVQGLDDEAHRRRKQMFMSLMSRERISRLADDTDGWWLRYAEKWARAGCVVLYHEAQEVLCRSVCGWAGVPLKEPEVKTRTRELTALFDAAGAVGPRHWWSRLQRNRANRWIESVIEQVRAGRITPPERSAAGVIASHRDPHGQPLPPCIAAVELLNVLRPTVAVSVYVTFLAHALHAHPEWRRQLAGRDGGLAEPFVQEVRRFYPFFPSVNARVRHDFEWKGYHFQQGTRAMLDLYGTNHDPRAWDAPEEFRPERFLEWNGSAFALIPQGGADHHLNHRCAGEWITLELMKRALRLLANRITYDVPAQDLHVDLSRLPALPRDQFVIANVRLAG